MPFKRPTLSELRDGNRKFMQAELEDVGALLRFANLKVLADMDAGMGHLHYAYLDYIALQTNPFTSTDEYLAGWMALKQVFRKPAAAAKSPAVQASGSVDCIIPVGSIINRGDGYQYRTDADLKIQADGFGMTDVQVAVGFGRKARAYPRRVECAGLLVGGVAGGAGPAVVGMCALGQVGVDDLAQEVAGLEGFCGVVVDWGAHAAILGRVLAAPVLCRGYVRKQHKQGFMTSFCPAGALWSLTILFMFNGASGAVACGGQAGFNVKGEFFMTQRRSWFAAAASAGVALALMVGAGAAQARSDVYWSVGVGAPGVALGVAIDSNVLINERIREELRNGSSPQAAIATGYDRAFDTILDSNVTTLIAGIALLVFGSGPVRGFAVVHCLGILTSMFSAILVSRGLVNLIYGKKRKLEKLAIGQVWKPGL